MPVNKSGFEKFLRGFESTKIVGQTVGWGTNKDGIENNHPLRNYLYALKIDPEYGRNLMYNSYSDVEMDDTVSKDLLEGKVWADQFIEALANEYPLFYSVIYNLGVPQLVVGDSPVVTAAEALRILFESTKPQIVAITTTFRGYFNDRMEISFVPCVTEEGTVVKHALHGDFIVMEKEGAYSNIIPKSVMDVLEKNSLSFTIDMN